MTGDRFEGVEPNRPVRFDPLAPDPVVGPPPAPVRDGLEQFFRFLGAPPVDVVSRLEECWGELVGPALEGPTRPVEIRDGVLVVLCDDPAWVAQVQWMEAQIKQRFGSVFPGLVLRRVVARTRT